jgi:ankyrin repeat protein
VEFLLARDGIEFNRKDEDGRTPLWLAARYGQKEVVELLLRTKGVDADVPDEGGMITLLAAFWYDHEGGRRSSVENGEGGS